LVLYSELDAKAEEQCAALKKLIVLHVFANEENALPKAHLAHSPDPLF
jgi:hypothetical protein